MIRKNLPLRTNDAGNCYVQTSGASCNDATAADLGSGGTEADKAEPVLVAAWSDPIIDAWQLRLQFSEPVDTVSGGGCSGTVASTAFTYSNASGSGATTLRSDLADNNGCDDTGGYYIKPRVDSRYVYADLGSDTVSLASTFYDAADNQSFATTKTVTYDPALEVYYPMDISLGDNGTTVQDVTANNRDGAVSGAALTNDMGEVSNQAYLFDGTDDYITVTGYKGSQGTTARTVSVWVKIESASSEFPILVQYGGSAC